MVDDTKPDVRFSDPSHADVNAKRALTPTPPPFDGPWIKPEKLARLPNLARDFQMNRDPHIAMQQRDLDRAANDHGETGTGSTMVGKDKPRMDHRPPPEMRHKTDHAQFGLAWLAEQKAAAMANAKVNQTRRTTPERSQSPTLRRTPER